MKIGSTVVLRLAAFLAAAGVVYAVTAREPAGSSLILIGAAAFAYVGLILRAVAREAGEQADEPAEPEHVAPTIWPFAFSIAAIGLVLGVVVARWMLIMGSVVFVASAIGWAMDVRRQHARGHST